MGLDRYTLSQLPASVLVHLLEGPSSPPPVGISADDTVNVNVIPQNTFVMVFSVSISTIALAARLYTKARLIKKWDLEDSE